MHWVIAGASGFLGTALVGDLERDGHDVTRLVRRAPRGPGESRWDPVSGEVDADVLRRADVVVNLAGANIGRLPWTASYRRTLRDSRISSTRTLAAALAGLADPPVFVAQSAIGWYGRDRGAEWLDEDSDAGSGFLADLVRDWEAATSAAEQANVRVVRLRTGLVLDRGGGALRLIALPFQFGLGARLGSGRQYMGVIGLPDWLAAVRHLATEPSCAGAYNLVLPEPPTNEEFTRRLAAALRRPAFLRVPGPVLRLALGEFSWELLGSRRLRPRRLLDSGFTFRSPTLPEIFAPFRES